MVTLVAVEEVADRKAMQRFRELPFALHRHERCWAPPVMAYERWRLDPDRNPFFGRGDAVYLLARHRGRVSGRVTAHVAEPGGAGHFGFFSCENHPEVAAALLDAARAWLADKGCTSMSGPLSFTEDDEAGVLVVGHEVPGVTGRPWHPAYYAVLFADAGLAPAGDRASWRHTLEPASATTRDVPPTGSTSRADPPPHAGPYGDPRLVLPDVAAVPDVSGALRDAGIRSAWTLARRARAADWEGCVIVRADGDVAARTAELRGVAEAAGYQWLIAPAPPTADGEAAVAPETVHRLFRAAW